MVIVLSDRGLYATWLFNGCSDESKDWDGIHSCEKVLLGHLDLIVGMTFTLFPALPVIREQTGVVKELFSRPKIGN
jgi:hypothetical protein